jgi:hypothetical protein
MLLDEGKVVEESGKYSRNSLQTTTLLIPLKNLNLMLVLVVRVVMKKKQELKNVFFLFVMILVNGMRKTNVRNCLI